MATPQPRIEAFDFAMGRVLAGRYRVEALLGTGWEGEVYRVTELRTGITRAAKIFYPQRNPRDSAFRRYATKLDRLRDCPLVIQYHHSEAIRFRRIPVTMLISELVEGELLEEFVKRQPGSRLQPYEALNLLHVIVQGVQQIHEAKEYHGDIHDRNVLVRRRGIGFEIKLLDFYHWGRPDRSLMKEDVVALARLLYDSIGGQKHYARQPPQIKDICRGLRRDLIVKRFPSSLHLLRHLEEFSWD